MSLKKNNISNKITININFNDKDNGYSVLTSKKIYNFVLNNMINGYNLINTQDDTSFNLNGKTKLKLIGRKLNKYKTSKSWEEILCKKYNNDIKGSPCKVGTTRKKIFFKIKSNDKIGGFGLYILHLNIGLITNEEHKLFIKTLKKKLGKREIFNHNSDVDWFHLKEFTK